MKNEKTAWFVTYSKDGPGDPDGFFCSECFKREIETLVGFIQGLASIVNPENTPHYCCQICRKDYRD